MNTIRLCFYRPRHDGHYLDDGIALHTGFWNFLKETWVCKGNVVKAWKIIKALWSSHVEIWTPHEDLGFDITTSLATDVFDAGYNTTFYGKCYTSTMRGDNAGTCVRPASEIFKNPSRWFYIPIELTDEAYRWLVEDMELKVANNKGYDKRIIWRFFMPRFLARWLKVDDPDKDNCSEFAENEVSGAFSEMALDLIFGGTYYKERMLYWLFRPNPSPIRLAKYCYDAGFTMREMDGSEVVI